MREQLCWCDIGNKQPHATADIIAYRLRDHKAARIDNCAYGNTAAFMKIGREHDLRDLTCLLTPECCAIEFCALETFECLCERGKFEQLRDSNRFNRYIGARKERNGNTKIVI